MAKETTKSVTEVCEAAKTASRPLARVSDDVKDRALMAIADAVDENLREILEANRRDVERGEREGLDSALIDRLTLTEERVAQISAGVRDVEALPDPVGEVLEGWRLRNGLHINKVRVPLGVVGVVYEARPNVTVDAAVLCIKSGNSVVLRGSSMAVESNRALGEILCDAAYSNGIPEGSIGLLEGASRDEMSELATTEGLVDLIVPRGGEGLKNALKEVAKVPVIYAADGNCHVYVDSEADIDMAVKVTVDAKTDRPGVCNAAETLLVHSKIAPEILPKVVGELEKEGVELFADARTRSLLGPGAGDVKEATEEDWATEYLSLKLAIKTVDTLEEAIDHVNRYGSGHSEAIITDSVESAEEFSECVDAACVYVNASTRFTDGGVFGMGAEIGNSTQKLHARGPVGLRELTTYKYVVEGSGQIRGSG